MKYDLFELYLSVKRLLDGDLDWTGSESFKDDLEDKIDNIERDILSEI